MGLKRRPPDLQLPLGTVDWGAICGLVRVAGFGGVRVHSSKTTRKRRGAPYETTILYSPVSFHVNLR